MSIILWDIPSTVGPWSPNTWKISQNAIIFGISLRIYALNLKGIPYKTEWIEYPDIASHCQKLGIAPTAIKRDGTPYYSLPAIYDPSTNLHIADSIAIVDYLEKQYPSSPTVFPHNTAGISIDFEQALDEKLDDLWKFVIPAIHKILNPASQGFYRTTREKRYHNKKLEDVAPKLESEEGRAEWAKVEKGFAGRGPFLLGERVSWADFVVGGHLLWFKAAWGDDDRKWKDVMAWQGGVWKTLSEALQAYEKQLD
ncbi:hypothetical protein BDN70DRAFT_912988 [Pholiota conissans]|uniref:GST N-terminal domain-containing protein n=1 Tax=Pholiota conissans TaxID=109636 RepID=A0A9P6CTZ9_9AGAR|nr:hypothetical protein BDN70DRAFT_912988 [Pholiota conissans]